MAWFWGVSFSFTQLAARCAPTSVFPGLCALGHRSLLCSSVQCLSCSCLLLFPGPCLRGTVGLSLRGLGALRVGFLMSVLAPHCSCHGVWGWGLIWCHLGSLLVGQSEHPSGVASSTSGLQLSQLASVVRCTSCLFWLHWSCSECMFWGCPSMCFLPSVGCGGIVSPIDTVYSPSMAFVFPFGHLCCYVVPDLLGGG